MNSESPPVSSVAAVLEQTVGAFGEAKWSVPEDFFQFSHFERVVKSLDWQSSPGYPYCLGNPTNEKFFQAVDGDPSQARMLAIWDLLLQRLLERTSDPIRLFIKPEPHKVKKLVEGRYRLISSVSVIDQIIDSMLFEPMNRKMVVNHLEMPSKFGWSPYVGGWKIMPVSGKLALDKSAWDWTVPAWLCELSFEVRRRLCVNPNPVWEELARWRYQQLFGNPWFITSGGQMLKQKTPGVMKSGCVNTISDNSIQQFMLHALCCFEVGSPTTMLWSMGDDTLQESLQEKQSQYEERLARHCLIKDSSSKIEFAGHEFRGMQVEPAYFGKHCYNLLHADPAVVNELGVSYSLLYHRSSRKPFIQRILRDLGAKLPQSEFLDVVFDGL